MPDEQPSLNGSHPDGWPSHEEDKQPIFVPHNEQDPGQPSVGTFDWQSEVIAFQTPKIKHRSYDLSYRDFRINKLRSDTERQDRLTMRIDIVLADQLRIFKANYEEGGIYVVASWLLEVGWIHMIYDYGEELEAITDMMVDMIDHNNNEERNDLLRRIDDMKIKMPSDANARKYLSPSMPAWLADSIRQVSMDLHMQQSDVCNLCIGLGMRTDFAEHPVSKVCAARIDKYEEEFSKRLDALVDDLTYQHSKYLKL